MKKEELFEAISDIDENEIEAAARYQPAAEKRSLRAVWTRWGTAAACLVVLLAAVVLGKMQSGGSAVSAPEGVKVVSARPVEEVAKGMSAGAFLESDEHGEWWRSYVDKMKESAGYQEGMQDYYLSMMEKLLRSDNENTVCSPLNIYLALSMLAETSDGNTRKQILDLLGVPDLETLRTRVEALSHSNQLNTPTIKSLLANSLWLNGSVNFNEETLNRLAETYRASSFSGTPGSEGMDKALQQWIDSNTGGLLKEYTKDLHLDPETVMGLVSTLYFRTAWADRFFSEENYQGTFHGTKGDAAVEMMHRMESKNLYWTDKFAALGLPLQDGGEMYFYLPQEGVDVNDLLTDPDLFNVLRPEEDGNWYYRMVDLSLPKFKVSEKTDLMAALKELGLTDALDPQKADFSPLTKEVPLWISSAEHAATVEIDEEGVTGAAYTDLMLSGSAMLPEEIVQFTLDRPFLFVIAGRDGSVLFSGAVRNVGE